MKRPQITLVVPFAVFPPQDVSSRRLFHIYRHLAQEFDIEIISLAKAHDEYFTGIIAPGLTEVRVPKSLKHQEAETALVQKLRANVADATLMQLYSLSPKYLQALKKSIKQADFVLTYQPYLLPAIQEISNKPIWYEASGLEGELKKDILPENELGTQFLEAIYELELKSCQISDLIITASSYDANGIKTMKGVDSNKIIQIPNGIDPKRLQFTPYETRLLNKEKLGFDNSFLAIFTGTGSSHNADEARSILNIASKLQDINFLLLGDLGTSFEARLTPPNVGFIPSVDAKTKSLILSLADLALNPVKNGSNNQSVIMEYFCQGIPVVSTSFGVKNLGLQHKKHCLIGDTWRFPELINTCRQENIVNKKIRVENVRKYVKNNFEWQEVANKFLGKFQSWIPVY
ncbi:hypothetical protein Xen7305DRAFT_00012050 [Xenococcus sp. PCC 7305]|uniref:glycosyltransferase n=1 Tax=Xenococcus sp. PCC 7305 TaxID=102125 RepID=UPI0002AC826A|nr:glycosyltransferase [Xenococcus sp. PCC 7305]ELS01501.1 hypothetical protein Xen7305DRAFT_00012050 [Xenococcus sp. PCC 7305]